LLGDGCLLRNAERIPVIEDGLFGGGNRIDWSWVVVLLVLNDVEEEGGWLRVADSSIVGRYIVFLEVGHNYLSKITRLVCDFQYVLSCP